MESRVEGGAGRGPAGADEGDGGGGTSGGAEPWAGGAERGKWSPGRGASLPRPVEARLLRPSPVPAQTLVSPAAKNNGRGLGLFLTKSSSASLDECKFLRHRSLPKAEDLQIKMSHRDVYVYMHAHTVSL